MPLVHTTLYVVALPYPVGYTPLFPGWDKDANRQPLCERLCKLSMSNSFSPRLTRRPRSTRPLLRLRSGVCRPASPNASPENRSLARGRGLESYSVIKEVYIAAPAEVLYDILTDPERLPNLIGLKGKLEISAGRFSKADRKGHVVVRGSYLEMRAKRKVVLLYARRSQHRNTTITDSVVKISFEPHCEGTWVRLTHRGSLALSRY